jgi:hypothetical protein
MKKIFGIINIKKETGATKIMAVASAAWLCICLPYQTRYLPNRLFVIGEKPYAHRYME